MKALDLVKELGKPDNCLFPQFGGVEPVRIQEPNSDAEWLLLKEADLLRFVNEHGNVDVVYDGRVYTVPAFAEGRARYSASKARYCARYGCE